MASGGNGAAGREGFLFVDRDGVLNVNRRDSVKHLSELRLLPGAARAVARLNKLGYRVVVVTNQACVGRGEVTEAALADIHEALHRRMAAAGGHLERVYVCPHRPEG